MGNSADFQWLLEQANDDQTMTALRKIWRNWFLVHNDGIFLEGNRLINLRFHDFQIQVLEAMAYSSMNILTEILKDGHHRRISGFDGTQAELVVDAGACEGFYTLAIKMASPGCRIIAVEPNPMAFDRLKKNVVLNDLQDVMLFQGALGNSNEQQTFEYADICSVIGSFHIVRKLRPWLPEEHIKPIKVLCTTLDSLYQQNNVNSADILKLDVEGAEGEVLESGLEALSKTRRVVVELHDRAQRNNLVDLMNANDFTLAYEESVPCGDLYFVRVH